MDFLIENWTYLLIPIFSAIAGWQINVIALKMTFYPLEYYGFGPWIGWQGIIPSRATRMAEKSVDLMLGKLINLKDQFSLLDSETIAEISKPELQIIARKILERIMRSQAPKIWKQVPEVISAQLASDIALDLQQLVENLLDDLKNNIEEHFDVKTTVIQTLIQDKSLLNEIFIICGKEEIKFIKRAGFYFGFIAGLIQMVIWYYYNPWWFLPLAGGIAGFATNWLAIKRIFYPLNPIHIGPWVIQGIFFKRQKEVATEYSKIVSGRVLNTDNIFNNILYGKKKTKLHEIIIRRIDELMNTTTGKFKLFLNTIGNKRYNVARNIAEYYFIDHFPIIINQISKYAEGALNLENTFKERMSNLTSKEFQGFLRPVFQEDEFKLILVSTALGAVAGLIELKVLF